MKVILFDDRGNMVDVEDPCPGQDIIADHMAPCATCGLVSVKERIEEDGVCLDCKEVRTEHVDMYFCKEEWSRESPPMDIIELQDGSCIGITDETVCLYRSEHAMNRCNPIASITRPTR